MQGAEPTTALAIATIPYGGESQVEGTLEQLLAGALKTLKAAGCSLVGGHTCEGAELALGFSVNGVASGGVESLLRKGGASAGDALVLTKAVRLIFSCSSSYVGVDVDENGGRAGLGNCGGA